MCLCGLVALHASADVRSGSWTLYTATAAILCSKYSYQCTRLPRCSYAFLPSVVCLGVSFFKSCLPSSLRRASFAAMRVLLVGALSSGWLCPLSSLFHQFRSLLCLVEFNNETTPFFERGRVIAWWWILARYLKLPWCSGSSDSEYKPSSDDGLSSKKEGTSTASDSDLNTEKKKTENDGAFESAVLFIISSSRNVRTIPREDLLLFVSLSPLLPNQK